MYVIVMPHRFKSFVNNNKQLFSTLTQSTQSTSQLQTPYLYNYTKESTRKSQNILEHYRNIQKSTDK